MPATSDNRWYVGVCMRESLLFKVRFFEEIKVTSLFLIDFEVGVQSTHDVGTCKRLFDEGLV